MANLGDKLSFGDLDGVVTRAVKVAGGTEYTVVVSDEDGARPVGGPAQDKDAAEIVTEGTRLDERLLDVEKDPDIDAVEDEENRRAEAERRLAGDGDAPASQKPTGDDKPLTAKADDKSAAKAPAKATGNKAAGSK